MEEKKVTKTGVYLRVSTRERALLGYGLDSQKDKNLAYLELYGYAKDNYELYIDDGVSAKDMNRPALQRLLTDVECRKVNMIIIYKLDRIARNVIDVYEIIKKLIDFNCNLVAVLDHIDIHSANGRMLVGVLAIIAQWEREVIIERTMDGLAAMVRKGKYPYPRCPFGWDKDENKYLHVNQQNSTIINILGDMAIQGYTINDLMRALANDYQIYKRASTVKNWLIRDMNIGKFVYHGNEYNDIVPPIMTEKKQQEIKKALSKRESKWDTEKYYYANLVHCACGEIAVQKVTVKKSKSYQYYECPVCYKRINQNDIIKQTLDEIFFHVNKKRKDVLEKNLSKHLDKINRKMDTIYIEYVNDNLDDKTYAFSISKLQDEKKILQEKVEAIMIDTKREFLNKTDKIKKKYIQSEIASVVVDMHLKLVISIRYKTVNK